MKLQNFLDKDQGLKDFIAKLPSSHKSLLSGGGAGSFSLFLSQVNLPAIIVVDRDTTATRIVEQLSGLVDVAYFPVEQSLTMQKAISSPDYLQERLASLKMLKSGKGVVVTTVAGLCYPISSPKAFNLKVDLAVGKESDLSNLGKWLASAGYRREKIVAGPGEFAIRGDIVDIYPLSQDEPIRIEFFGDEVDTIKTFDLASQRSQDDLEKFTIYPASDRVDEVLDSSILEYLADNGLLIFMNWDSLQETSDNLKEQDKEYLTAHPEAEQRRLSFDKVIDQFGKHQLFVSEFQRGLRMKLDQLFDWQARQVQDFYSQIPFIKTEINAFLKTGKTVVIQADNAIRLKDMMETFASFDMKFNRTNWDGLIENTAQFVIGNFSAGFDLPTSQLVVITEKELFGRQKKVQRRIKTFDNAQKIKSYSDIKPGDYVVHTNHGIGRFEGIQTIENNGQTRDYITITYQKGDQLFVPTDHLAMVQKYVGSEGKKPKLNKLGGTEWAKTKRKVQHMVDDIADDLIELYAKRQSIKGIKFDRDDELQAQFEANFPYQETSDQLKAIDEIKHDMESDHPMDRLLVGDVGFGKTEVALRAAFKAIASGKQVAFLVPTTILASQHYQTIKDRFNGFPIETAMLSRFQTKKESKEIAEKLQSGDLDLVVGTHRLLSDDIKFKDLGLLIVDEEQRFGVKHKEKLKQLKANIDVLTLTATPIPRTLHMSMVGVRDLSFIETPPKNRYPVQTYVIEDNMEVIKEAIERELLRDGQVFYVHNQVKDIEEVVAKISQAVPDARIAFAHGQMTENQLEDVLYAFLNHEYDVLVTTTIIETGIDMPNVNTMLVKNADHFGLSQLYQLRGRIGRSARIAYAYFLYQANKVLTETGEKRLDAIRDFTELGSGFKIAMSDLSIRGAGNLLGAAQHGFVDSVGYDLYSQMLEDAIKERKGQKPVRKSNSEVNLELEAYLPSDYIDSQDEKIAFYKKIRQAESAEVLDDISDELIERFGSYPTPVENLLTVARVKMAADQASVLTINKLSDKLEVEFNTYASEKLKGPNVFKALEHVSWRAKVEMVDQHLKVQLLFPLKYTNRQVFNELEIFLEGAKDANR
ncbi:MAG: transcription-repair coupling factor [Lactobacillus sp.]|nr:transcription-repair coupling factor [Lactobacillus sp.]